MGREQVTNRYTVQDDAGRRYTVTQTTVFESGRLIGGGEAPVDVRHELDDGTRVEPSIDETAFFDHSRGKGYERV